MTSQTIRNAIQGSAPYLTFDGGRTRAVDANDLLGITLSDGTRYTPSTKSYLQHPSFCLLQVRVLLCLMVSSMKVVEKI
ncbi:MULTISPECIES: hypothetical protein [unclassified Gilliamella]|uniref:hypothetical protein n=1 Tax=unclassified Gilliamella TaxID=2685620 RepID=UPI00226AD3EC|nr:MULTISPECIES: hypothetical protein [unclassified Gilliamella]MCX8596045.1 hypothetical protein [Gilliamella sp. B3493]MCX8598243.1 hypothetical protein [Gilliamella sp. B3486]MCX8688606.1 hypothetical protein [Gilliamella sp. B2973]MCX8704230.1 hypothetical protein [Gilliamella sp. B3127]